MLNFQQLPIDTMCLVQRRRYERQFSARATTTVKTRIEPALSSTRYEPYSAPPDRDSHTRALGGNAHALDSDRNARVHVHVHVRDPANQRLVVRDHHAQSRDNRRRQGVVHRSRDNREWLAVQWCRGMKTSWTHRRSNDESTPVYRQATRKVSIVMPMCTALNCMVRSHPFHFHTCIYIERLYERFWFPSSMTWIVITMTTVVSLLYYILLGAYKYNILCRLRWRRVWQWLGSW